MQRLYLHSGARLVEPEHLYTINVNRPENASDRWKGTQHGTWRDALLRNVESHGLEIAHEEWATQGDHEEDLFGVVECRPNEVLPTLSDVVPGGAAYYIGSRHSNRMRFSHIIACGARVFVCDNLAVSGERVVRRKHTIGCDVDDVAKEALDLWIDKIVDLRANIVDLQGIDMTGSVGQARADRFLIDLGDSGLIAWSGVGKVWREWKEPRHPEFRDGSAWSLWNCVTEIAKEIASPSRASRLSDGARRLLLAPEIAARRAEVRAEVTGAVDLAEAEYQVRAEVAADAVDLN